MTKNIKKDQAFMRLAIHKARLGIRKGQTPFGACIVSKERVIACVHNGVWQTTDITAHAEIRAIRSACKKLKTIDLNGCMIYSTCEPCPMCFSACHWARIDKIVYGTSIADAHEIGFHELDIPNRKLKQLGGSPIKIIPDFLREESRQLFVEWCKRRDKRVY